MNISEAKVILNHAADKVMLQTDLPCPFTVEGLPSQTPLILTFDATYDTGEEYVRNVFGIEPEVINTR